MSSSAGSTSSANAVRGDEDRSPAQVVDGYLGAFYRGDFVAARERVADGFSFQGPFLQVEGAATFFARAEGLRRIVRGHRTVRQWQHGDDVSTLYEVEIETPAAAGSVLMSEWDRVRNGKVVSASVVFDTAAFGKLVPQAGGASS